MKKLNINTIVIFFALSVSILLSQELYYEGIGEATDLKEAQKNALANLSENIQVSISSLFRRVITEENLSISKDYTKNQVESYSAISLRNVECIETKHKKLWIVTAKVYKGEIDKLFLERKSEIRTLINTGKQAEKRGDLSSSLKNYYWAYLLSCSIPDTLYAVFPQEAMQGNSRAILIPKIEKIIRNINFNIENTYSEEGEFIAKLKVDYRDNPVQELSLSYYDGKFQDWVEVSNGECYLTQSGDFSSNDVAVNILVEYKFEEAMAHNQNVLQVNNGLRIPNINNNVSINLDLSQYVQFNFKVQKRDKNIMYFYPELENISVSSIEWNFGDGKTSNIMNPIHTYVKGNIYEVSMTINNNPRLKVIKNIDLLNGVTKAIKENIVKEESVISGSDIIISKVEPVVSNEPVKIKTIKNDIVESQPVLNELLQLKDLAELREFLGDNNRLGRLIYGNSDDFENKEGLHTVVVDIETNEILGVMHYTQNTYIDIKDESKTESLTEKYIGKKIAAIWVEVF